MKSKGMAFMTRLTASQLREDMATAINKVAFGGERIVLQRNNKDVAALVPMEDLTLLKELEDRADLEEIKKALAEPGSNIPWEEIKKKLGI
jgi:PHD/YefM family antitoxin component YafN of YafNO toxin-antitoxin module